MATTTAMAPGLPGIAMSTPSSQASSHAAKFGPAWSTNAVAATATARARALPHIVSPHDDRNLLKPTNVRPDLGHDPTTPSPVVSETGTVFEDIDENLADDAKTSVKATIAPLSTRSADLKLQTGQQNVSVRAKYFEDDEAPPSAIYAPSGYGAFKQSLPGSAESIESSNMEADSNSQQDSFDGTYSMKSTSSENTAVKVELLDGEIDDMSYDDQRSPTSLAASLASRQDWTSTPRAHTRQELRALSRPSSSLASIEEGDDHTSDQSSVTGDDESPSNIERSFFRSEEDEIKTLNNALTECWTLCNTLAGLSHNHRGKGSGRPGYATMHQQAWKSCWKLCQTLYDTNKQGSSADIRSILQSCRDFCQVLFEVRVRDNEATDSVLRVSFELNNHLFNTHDRQLPEAFRERTLDFYVTLCHRLVKQKEKAAEETDALLSACWGLAEMLFSIRQIEREERVVDEELLTSAIQACWELCDLFRNGWIQVRPERQTPRPIQTTFTQAIQQALRSGLVPVAESLDKANPETPTTVFDDSTVESPYEVPVPNIVVLDAASDTGTTSAASSSRIYTSSGINQHPRPTSYKWPDNCDSASLTTNSRSNSFLQPRTAGISAHALLGKSKRSEEQTMVLSKSLFVRAAVVTNRGFIPLRVVGSSESSTRSTSSTSLPQFVRTLSDTAFGSQPWQMKLLDRYKAAILDDPTFDTLGAAADERLVDAKKADVKVSNQVRLEVATVVKGMVASAAGWTWIKDLFRFAFGLHIEEVLGETPELRVSTGGTSDHTARSPRTSNNIPTFSRGGSVSSTTSKASRRSSQITPND